MSDGFGSSFTRWAAFSIFGAVAVMAAIQTQVPYLNELGSHTIDALRIWRGEMDCTATYRLPLGYPALLAPFIALLGEAVGVKAANILAFTLLLCAALAFYAAAARDVSPGLFGSMPHRIGATLLILVLTFYPYVILNTARTTEALPAATFLTTFFWLLFRRPTYGAVVAAGIVLALGMHVRANMATLLLPALLWIVWRAEASWARRGLLGGAGLASMGSAYVLCSFIFAGCAWFSPTNGGYNLYAGNNPLSAAYLASDQNAEYSIVPALQARGFSVQTVPDGYEVPQATYMALAKQYIADCPLCAAKLAVQKATVFLSPRLKNAGGIVERVVQYALAALTLVALSLALWLVMHHRRYLDAMLLVVFAAYALPFIATNADPRLRFPLDMLALCYLALRLSPWLDRLMGWRSSVGRS